MSSDRLRPWERPVFPNLTPRGLSVDSQQNYGITINISVNLPFRQMFDVLYQMLVKHVITYEQYQKALDQIRGLLEEYGAKEVRDYE